MEILRTLFLIVGIIFVYFLVSSIFGSIETGLIGDDDEEENLDGLYDDDEEEEEEEEEELEDWDYYDYDEDEPFGAVLIKDVPSPDPLLYYPFRKGERIFVLGEVSNSPELFLVIRPSGLASFLLTRYDFKPEIVLQPSFIESRVIQMGSQNFDSTLPPQAAAEPVTTTTKTEVLKHSGVDCTHWEVVKETYSDGTSQDYLRCLTSGDKMSITLEVAPAHVDDGHVHWEPAAAAVAV